MYGSTPPRAANYDNLLLCVNAASNPAQRIEQSFDPSTIDTTYLLDIASKVDHNN